LSEVVYTLLKNIFEESELNEDVVVQKFRTTERYTHFTNKGFDQKKEYHKRVRWIHLILSKTIHIVN